MSVASTMLLSACSVFGVRSGTEEPSYRVIDRLAGGVEIREYAPRLAAEVTVAADPQARPINEAFGILAGYIFGANRAQAKIAMTAPVEVRRGQQIAMTAPVETAEGEGRLRMRFFLPKSVTSATAPVPDDGRIRLTEVPAQTIAVYRFTGLGLEGSVRERQDLLLGNLQGGPWRPAAEPVAYFYDPPWTIPFLRRNEVAVTVARDG